MFFYDTDKHSVPHLHAEFQGDVGVYSIPDGELLAGKLPPKKHKMVVFSCGCTSYLSINHRPVVAPLDGRPRTSPGLAPWPRPVLATGSHGRGGWRGIPGAGHRQPWPCCATG